MSGRAAFDVVIRTTAVSYGVTYSDTTPTVCPRSTVLCCSVDLRLWSRISKNKTHSSLSDLLGFMGFFFLFNRQSAYVKW